MLSCSSTSGTPYAAFVRPTTRGSIGVGPVSNDWWSPQATSDIEACRLRECRRADITADVPKADWCVTRRFRAIPLCHATENKGPDQHFCARRATSCDGLGVW